MFRIHFHLDQYGFINHRMERPITFSVVVLDQSCFALDRQFVYVVIVNESNSADGDYGK